MLIPGLLTFAAGVGYGFSHAAHNGFEVGAGQSGASLHLPAGIPTQVVRALQEAAHFVFTHAFVDAMRPTLLLPISILVLAAVGTLFVRAQKPAMADAAIGVGEPAAAAGTSQEEPVAVA